MTNHLINEKSPYLLQHVDNPVDWYPWCKEAFQRAKLENKPIFLSIGYSTCHWCHVMANESFVDLEVARLLNKYFICIKVDREERHDIDNIYMKVSQIMSGTGGWPLTIIMNHNKEPFFSGTYIPKKRRYGRIGLLELIPHIIHLWEKKQDKISDLTQQIKKNLNNSSINVNREKLDKSLLRTVFEQLSQTYDEEYGGFGRSPKFPTPHNLLFLLRYWKRYGNKRALEMVENTLNKMRNGGIYDHVGCGFHRYSTDNRWFIPHFEKMLYDQALISIVYIELFQATRKSKYAKVACEILDYVAGEMRSSEGGFYSAEDADSEGVEGKFYLWYYNELKIFLSRKDLKFIETVYNISKTGNYKEESTNIKNGLNIFYIDKPIDEIIDELNYSKKDFNNRLEKIRKKLYIYRDKRIHPFKDDKILTDWNGLMIAAFSRASMVFNNKAYLEIAVNAMDFILGKMKNKDDSLLHSYRDGRSSISGNLDDYVFVIYGLIELYESTFQYKYLKIALNLNRYLIENFWDSENGGFYFTDKNSEKLLFKYKDLYDGAIPSGNSIEMLNLLRLSRFFSITSFEDMAEMIGEYFSKNIINFPSAYSQFMVALDFQFGPSYEIIIVGDANSKDTEDMIHSVYKEYVPNKIVFFKPKNMKIEKNNKFLKLYLNYVTINDKTTVYICQNYACSAPLTDKNQVIENLK